MKAIEINPFLFEFYDSHFDNDIDVVMKMVTMCGACLKYAHDDLKNNKDIVMKAVDMDKYNLITYYYGDDTCLWYDNKLMPIEQHDDTIDFDYDLPIGRHALHWAGSKLKDDVDVVIKSITNNPPSIKYASDRLRNIRNFKHIMHDNIKVYDSLKECNEYINSNPTYNNDLIYVWDNTEYYMLQDVSSDEILDAYELIFNLDKRYY